MPGSQAGVAAAVASTSRQVGSALGVAVIGVATTSGLHSLHAGLATASHAGWWIATGCGATMLLVGLVSTSAWAEATAQRTAAQLGEDAQRVRVGA
jgi:hypothetical protein